MKILLVYGYNLELSISEMGESFFRGKEMKLFNIRSLIDYFM